MRCYARRAPSRYGNLVAGAPGVRFLKRAASADVVHLFCHDRRQLEKDLRPALDCVAPGGMLWVSWPKKTSPLHRDLNGNDVRALVLPTGWVDVKVCAVDQDWSALKFLKRR